MVHARHAGTALAGLGVALVPRLHVETELAEGRLVAPWPEGQSISKNFSLILPEPIRLSDGPLRAFADWLLSEVHTLPRTG
ncbi:TPA: LysR substrate-binding domain-containing protein [Klebsiella pneumoniae]|uniref:LysR substrate-binding domain-containing protein n=1 Tax=Enterobacteriaceae TaxID=543 RepID=UPI0004E34796|nr:MULTISPECIES: LysR substrate-binding domain-containing protein [Klebsiella]KFC37961.1 hypothetical protein FF19_20295 [Klebsiella michiganensis]MCW9244387.1 LysR substrate-binding domain-containing protein [Klebsiella pneumoniae]MCW9468680.1 LysR substrate-binding domain-containing protein [Klebsiella michiganensis]MCW9616974.1 LysR substrate-binding domain-containing protein [Klebsiella michiganensis]MDX4980941.1 LysR substrate-binding domain-containing protein [Klebsiella pneumoniae]